MLSAGASKFGSASGGGGGGICAELTLQGRSSEDGLGNGADALVGINLGGPDDFAQAAGTCALDEGPTRP